MHRLVFLLAFAACNGSATAEKPLYRGGPAPLSRQAGRTQVRLEGGLCVIGSTPQERAQAYADYEATAGHDAAKRGSWFAREWPHGRKEIGAFRLDETLVTMAAYREFLRDTGRPGPSISKSQWQAQRFSQRYDTQVKRFNWRGQLPPAGRDDHPVVLVTWNEARSYCEWRGKLDGQPTRLPSALELEHAARGCDGQTYPWGPRFDAKRLNSAVAGPHDLTPVRAYPSIRGIHDLAGNVFQWTQTPWQRPGRMTVKGSAWDDFGGLGRGAAQHGRRNEIRHAIVGFRCASDV